MAEKIIHQLVHTLSYGDAISGEVLALARIFRANNIESKIFAMHVHPKLEGQAEHYQSLLSDFTGEIILHYSLGSPLNELYRRLKSASRTMIYHNLTPAHWFQGINPRIVRDIEAGTKELPELCSLSVRLLADSAFNAGELKKLGFDAEILELPLDSEKWSVATNPGIYSLVKEQPGVHVMHVGRLAPNKSVEDIIKIFYFLHHKIEPKSTLWLVGIDTDTELYSFSLRRLVHELDLSDAVRFVGCLADEEVKALYKASTVYLCMSEHEGFCLPIVEAMYFGLPVVAYSSTAIADTVGTGGILVAEKRHAEIAELLYEIYSNSELREKLTTAGKKRVEDLSLDRFHARVNQVFMPKSSAYEARAIGDE